MPHFQLLGFPHTSQLPLLVDFLIESTYFWNVSRSPLHSLGVWHCSFGVRASIKSSQSTAVWSLHLLRCFFLLFYVALWKNMSPGYSRFCSQYFNCCSGNLSLNALIFNLSFSGTNQSEFNLPSQNSWYIENAATTTTAIPCCIGACQNFQLWKNNFQILTKWSRESITL